MIDKDVDIAMLVLAANPGPEGPGPIITTMAKTVGSFPIPVVVVPGDLSDDGYRRVVVGPLMRWQELVPSPLDRASAVAIC